MTTACSISACTTLIYIYQFRIYIDKNYLNYFKMFVNAKAVATFVPFVKVLGYKEIQKTLV